jgi:deazaflavin-dependent oxidoreductase (nitroreductase family)
VIGVLLRLGVTPPHTYLLTVRGRKSGRLHSTPVTLVEEAGNRWLVAPYGEVGWVRNARAAEQVALTRSRRLETVRIEELSAEDAAPVLKKYLAQVPVVRPFFDVTPKSNCGILLPKRHDIQYSDPVDYPDIFLLPCYARAELKRRSVQSQAKNLVFPLDEYLSPSVVNLTFLYYPITRQRDT